MNYKYIICHNCHSHDLIDEDMLKCITGNRDTGIAMNLHSNTTAIIAHSGYCPICNQVAELSKDNHELLALVSKPIIYCHSCDTYIFINTGRLFECDICEQFYRLLMDKFILLADRNYQTNNIADYGYDIANNECVLCPCIDHHDVSVIDKKLDKFEDIGDKLDFLANILNS